MVKNIMVLPDGTEVHSGAGTVNALQSVSLLQRVNTGTELTLGSVCANMLEATVFTPAGGLELPAGAEVALYREDEGGNRTKVGLFTLEEPTRPSANRYKIRAYDRVSWLDRDLTRWLEGLDGWPYSLIAFARLVCEACGLELADQTIPNGDWQVQQFMAKGITGRQLMQWVGQACGRFCRATPDGGIELAWYTPKEITLTPVGAHRFNAVAFEDYRVAPVDKVQIQQTESDVGAVYGEGSNAYILSGNRLLASDSLEPLQAVAKVLYEMLQGVTYTPCNVSVPATNEISAGDILSVTDRNGRTFPVYVMTKTRSGLTDTLECTGSPRRDCATAVNEAKIKGVDGKVLELEMSLEGLKVTNRGVEARLTNAETQISQNTASIALRATKTEVDAANNALQETVASQLEVLSEKMTLTFDKTEQVASQVDGIKTDGVSRVTTSTGYTFDENGFTVEKSGQVMKTQITEDGMTVYKGGSGVLTANNQGVDAVNLHASTYLFLGGKSRFENYGDSRTGCFWVGG